MDFDPGEFCLFKAEKSARDYESLSDETHDLIKKIRRKGSAYKCRTSDNYCRKYYSKGNHLRRAASLNDVDRVKSILSSGKVNPDAADEQGRRALHLAASRGYAEVIAALIKAGADPNLEDNLGNTPLHLAVYTGSLQTVVNLITGGCRVRRTALVPHTPLELARSKYNMLKKQQSCNVLQLQVFRVILLLRHAVLVDVVKASQNKDIESLMNDLSSLQLQEASTSSLPDEDSEMP